MTQITKHLDDLKRRISDAASNAGRNETEVSVLAVSKRHGATAIVEAQAAGLLAMGENYLQEALEKIPQIARPVEWHFIGRVQSNKTRLIAEHFDWVQTVASERIARRLNDQRPDGEAPLNVLAQVNTDGSDHGGAVPEDIPALCRFIDEQPRLRLRGLMTIPLPGESPEAQRAAFRPVKELFEQLKAEGLPLDTLSMGMSDDLEAAIAEGSTMVRIGTALFGPRPG